MNNILHTYHLNFYIKTTCGVKYGLCETSDPTYHVLSNFISCIPWAESAGDVVIGLNEVLSRKVPNEEFETQTISVQSSLSKSVFIDHTNPSGFSKPDLVIPTTDFRDIMLEWKKFLQEIKK